MKIWQNLLEPHEPDCHTFLRPLVKICQIVILFQSSQNLEDFSFRDEISESYFKMSNPSEPERAAEARRAVVASEIKTSKTTFYNDQPRYTVL